MRFCTFATTLFFIQTIGMDDSVVRLIIFFSVLLMMALAEYLAPRRTLNMGYQRWPANLLMVGLDVLIVRIILPAGAIGAAWWAHEHGFGLFNLLAWHDSITIILAIVLLDLVIYAQHVLFHAVPLLWRLHMVHHADRDIDVSTGLRFHPIEIVLSILIKMLVIVLLGAPILAVIIFEILLNSMAMFNHANIRLPLKIDAVLRLLVVTPDVHRIHHSVIKSETNSNYGFNLSCWDRLFGTYQTQPKHGHDNMIIGLEHLQAAPTHRLGFMLRLPFSGDLGQYPMLMKKKREGKDNA